MTVPPWRPSIDREPAMRLAATEYRLCGDLLADLTPEQWAAPTANTGWTVRDTAGHMLGMVQMVSGLPRLIGQMSTSMRRARKARATVSIDYLTALQVELNAALTADGLVRQWREPAPRAVRCFRAAHHRRAVLTRRRPASATGRPARTAAANSSGLASRRCQRKAGRASSTAAGA
jgi:uncharacterized protein (TIGR03083 family)